MDHSVDEICVYYVMPQLAQIGKGDVHRSPKIWKFGVNCGILVVFISSLTI